MKKHKAILILMALCVFAFIYYFPSAFPKRDTVFLQPCVNVLHEKDLSASFTIVISNKTLVVDDIAPLRRTMLDDIARFQKKKIDTVKDGYVGVVPEGFLNISGSGKLNRVAVFKDAFVPEGADYNALKYRVDSSLFRVLCDAFAKQGIDLDDEIKKSFMKSKTACRE